MQTIVEIIDGIDDRAGADGPAGMVSALTAEVLLLAEELCVARDRFDVALSLAEQGEDVTERSVAEYVCTDSDVEQRLVAHTAFYEQIFNRLSDAIAAGRAE